MKNYLKLSLAVFALIFFFGAADVKAQGPINEILKRMDEHYKALTSLRSNIMMDKYNAQLDEHDVTEGRVIYLPTKGKDATVRIDWVKPVEETLAVKDKKYVLYRPKLKQAITGKVSDAQKNTQGAGMLDFMNMSKEQLKETYKITYLGQENVAGGGQTWHLELTPKTPKSYKSSEIWVNGNGMPIQTKVIEKNNDSTTILLSNLQENVTINGSEFKVSLPGDTKIIKN
jgi:outer membrane lipoprotein-sorting protein